MTTLREAAQQALEALEYHVEQTRPIHRTSKAITTLKAALAEPEGGGNLPPPLPAEHYCDTHCTWADHAAGCVRAHGIGGNDD